MAKLIQRVGRRLRTSGQRLFWSGVGIAVALGATGQCLSGPPGARVLPAGDSITRGSSGHDAHDPRVGGYRTRLWRRLSSDGLRVDVVGPRMSGPRDIDRHHAGHDGWTIAQVHDGLRSWLPRFHPDIILLMAGTNDIWWGTNPEGAPRRLAALLDDLAHRSPATHVIVASIPPFADPTLQARAVAFNAAAQALVEQRRATNAPLTFLDAHAIISAQDLADGVHPHAGGYDKLADAWYETLAPLLRTRRR